ncbi:hypothetical protein SAMN05444392_12610 [Seinonella peptonophila]|uniref:YtkA-like n=1 Tax=Seinonella peptonophila TaxID=112248 RepID=A0A1M5BLF8_9BACL|nr:hypothetical protein [Seinonella peptonophila]SHF43381.1 hypothetical protein SAMN05444392_12610 [Seinonella peptonophila]
MNHQTKNTNSVLMNEHHHHHEHHMSHHGANEVVTDWTSSIHHANQEGQVEIIISDQHGNRIEEFDISHDKKMHLIVVSEDLSFFDHLHPEWKGNGTFIVNDAKFPKGGKFRLYADFIPKGGSHITATHDFFIEGEQDKQPIIADELLTKDVNDLEIVLTMNPSPSVQQDTQLIFTLEDAKYGEPITDLEQVLGAVGHVVIISEDLEQYLHVHPLEEDATGPEARFATKFPTKGLYKIWGQFQRSGQLITVSYVVNVS